MKNRINCGITALESLTKLNKISVKTLNSFAKDNGLDLKSYKLEEDKIKTLDFPFIVYTPNHFQFVSKQEDLKGLELTGLVLTEQYLDEPEIEGESIIGETNNEPIPLIDVVIEKFCTIDGKEVPYGIPPCSGENVGEYPTQPTEVLAWKGFRPTKQDSWYGNLNDPYPEFRAFYGYTLDSTGRAIKIDYIEPLFPKDLAAQNTTYKVLQRRGKGSKLTISDLDDNQFALGWGLTKLIHEYYLLKIQNDNLFDYINILNDYTFPQGSTTSIAATYSLNLTIGATISSPTYSNNIHLGSVLSVYDNSYNPLQNEIKINYDGASYSIPVGLTLSGNNLSLLDVSGQTVSQITLNSSGSNVDVNQISFGGPTGLTSSTRLQFNTTNNNLILGFSHSITGTSSQSSIIGGFCGNIANTCYSSILGGFCGSIATASNFSSIIGGYCNNVFSDSTRSSIIGGSQQSIELSTNSIIGGGNNNSMISSNVASIIGGNVNILNNSQNSTIISSCGSNIENSNHSAVVGGQYGKIYDNSCQSFIGGGYSNRIDQCTNVSAIVSGRCNKIYSSSYSLITGGRCNKVCCLSNFSIIGGYCNTIYCQSSISTIVSGYKNTICESSSYSSIINGCQNTIRCFSTDSVIVGGCVNMIQNNSNCSSIINGTGNTISGTSNHSSIINGRQNTICDNSNYSSIINGRQNKIFGTSSHSSIIGGYKNEISDNSCYSSILGGKQNTIFGTSSHSSIIGGFKNGICNSFYSSTIGGCMNGIADSAQSVIIGGNNLLLNNKPNTVLVPTLLVSGSFSTDCGNTFGINGSFTAGANTITVCNGVIVSIV